MLGTTIGAFYGLPLGIYDGIEIGSLECPSNGTSDEKLEGLLLGARLGSLDVFETGSKEGNELGFWDCKVLGTTLEDLNELLLVT